MIQMIKNKGDNIMNNTTEMSRSKIRLKYFLYIFKISIHFFATEYTDWHRWVYLKYPVMMRTNNMKR